MGAKDWLVEKAATAMLNQAVLKPYGVLTKLKLNSTERSIDAELELKGETQPVQIQVRGYEVQEEGEHTYLVIKNLETSREWLTTLARDFAVERPFEVPGSVKKFLPMLLGT
ncbi:MAG TPA: hypothetical protein VK846_19180 [Candidatus Limnocylindria bacterium]|nr:hypothetical protein [Candidatus Limnocylindria bacterium]